MSKELVVFRELALKQAGKKMRGNLFGRAAMPLLAISVLASACAGDGGSSEAPTTTSTSTTMAGGMGVSLGDIQDDIFTPACGFSGCHDSFTAAGDLDLSTAQASFDELVNVVSLCGTAVLVVPGNPNSSYLMDKLGDGATPCGAVMPIGASQLSDNELADIRSWIQDGAAPALYTETFASTSTTSDTTTSTNTTSTTLVEAADGTGPGGD
jgi:hypothetical protein